MEEDRLIGVPRNLLVDVTTALYTAKNTLEAAMDIFGVDPSPETEAELQEYAVLAESLEVRVRLADIVDAIRQEFTDND